MNINMIMLEEELMDTGSMPSSKFAPVQMHSSIIRRGQLLDRLNQACQSKMTLVVAPAGYGKSSLLCQWADELDNAAQSLAWVNLDGQDGQVGQFLACVVFSLYRAGLDVSDLITGARNRYSESRTERVIARILASIARHEKPVYLVFEDYHLIECEAINLITKQLCQSSDQNLSLIIDSRVRPDLDVSRLAAAGDAHEIGPAELQFSREETFAVLDTIPSEEAKTEIMTITEGWPVAVQLARIKKQELPGQPILDGMDGGLVASYLAEQILSVLDAETQALLLALSFLDRFNAQLTNAVLDSPDGWQKIANLSAFHALFVPLDESTNAYRLHHLFAEYLQDFQRRRDPDQGRVYLMRASGWFAGQGDMLNAVRYASLAKDYQTCRDIILNQGGWAIILMAGIEDLRTVLKLVPHSFIQTDSGLLTALAYLRCKDGQIQDARALISASLALIPDAQDSKAAVDNWVIALLIKLYEDDSDMGLPSQMCDDPLYQHTGVTPLGRGILRCYDILAALYRHDLVLAKVHLDEAFLQMRQSGSVLGLNYCYLHAAVIALYQLDFELADAAIERALTMADENFGADSGLKNLAALLEIVSRALQGRVQSDDIQNLIDVLEVAINGDCWCELYMIAAQALVMLARQTGDIDGVHHALCTLIQFARMEGLTRLVSLASQQRTLLETHHSFVDRTGISSVIAMDKSEDVDPVGNVSGEEGALFCLLADIATMREALILGGDIRSYLPVIAKGISCGALGVLLAESEVMERLKTVRNLLRQDESQMRLSRGVTVLLDMQQKLFPEIQSSRLSDREMDILQYLAQGYSNRRIASAMELTENTVKFHLKSLFSKLAVHKRTTAVVEAQRLGLIRE